MSVYDMPARMSTLMQNAYGIANYGLFPVGGNVPQQYTQGIINGVGSSVASLMDYSSSMGVQPMPVGLGMGIMQPSSPLGTMMGLNNASAGAAFNPFQQPQSLGGLAAGGVATGGAGSQDVLGMMTQLLQVMSLLIQRQKGA